MFKLILINLIQLFKLINSNIFYDKFIEVIKPLERSESNSFLATNNPNKILLINENKITKFNWYLDYKIEDYASFNFENSNENIKENFYVSSCLFVKNLENFIFIYHDEKLYYTSNLEQLNDPKIKTNINFITKINFKSNFKPNLICDELNNTLILKLSSLEPYFIENEAIKLQDENFENISIPLNNLSIEYNLLQHVLNNDFHFFTSYNDYEIFADKEIILIYHKLHKNYTVSKYKSNFLDENEKNLKIFYRILMILIFTALCLNIIFDYLKSSNYNLKPIIGYIKENTDGLDQLKNDAAKRLDASKQESLGSIETIDSTAGLSV